jgi:pre-rRNA-processing protein RIX1
MSSVETLQAVTQRLCHTPIETLPHAVYFLASSILSCSDALRTGLGQFSSGKDDTAFQVQKLKVRITSLLQDRSPKARFAAVVLVKTVVEAGGKDALASCEPWVRGLLSNLNKADLPSSKRLYLLTITRIFALTRQYPELTREITTPLLPAFVAACIRLGNLTSIQSDEGIPPTSNPYLKTSLQCMRWLLPHHPGTFRPFASKLYRGLTKLITGQSSESCVTHLAQSLWVALHFCTPKNSSSSEWFSACKGVVVSAHDATDQIFRAYIEEWESFKEPRSQNVGSVVFSKEPQIAEGGPLDLPSWSGLLQGSRVLVSLLHLLAMFFLEPSSQTVDLPIGLVLSLTSRLLHLRDVPGNTKNKTNLGINPEIGRDEREFLSMILPSIHRSTLGLLSRLMEAVGPGLQSAGQEILEQCLWIDVLLGNDQESRILIYKALGNLISLVGISMPKNTIQQLSRILECCCKDVSASDSERSGMIQIDPKRVSELVAVRHPNSLLRSTSESERLKEPHYSPLRREASVLLGKVLEHVPAQFIPHNIRAQIDRTAIVNDEKRMLLASVMNPSPSTSSNLATPSVMPFLARSGNCRLEIQGLLRPRVPVMHEASTSASVLETYSSEDLESRQRSTFTPTLSDLKEGRRQLPPADASTENVLLDKFGYSSKEDRAPTSILTNLKDDSKDHPVQLDERDDSHLDSQARGMKRDLALVDASRTDGISKRSCNGDWGSEPDLDFSNKPIADLSKQTIITTEVNHSNAEKDDSAATTRNEREASIAVPGRPVDQGLIQRERVDDNASDSDIPTIHLKTSSEEEDEDEEFLQKS